MEETVRFELTDPFESSVFKTDALSRALPRFLILVRPERFELPTPKFVAWYSIQLSYGRILKHTMGYVLECPVFLPDMLGSIP